LAATVLVMTYLWRQQKTEDAKHDATSDKPGYKTGITTAAACPAGIRSVSVINPASSQCTHLSCTKPMLLLHLLMPDKQAVAVGGGNSM
jgi:hypothetical protein